MTTTMTARSRRRRVGLTLIELMISMVVGVIVISTVTAYVRTTDRNITGATAREDYTRKGRFLGISLRRDLGEAGVALTSLPSFGSVAVFNDTIAILKVPFDTPVAAPLQDPAYNIAVKGTSLTITNTSDGGADCGNTCVRLRRQAVGTNLTLVSGMLAAVTQAQQRRLILVNTVLPFPGTGTDSIAVTFRSATSLLHRPSITNGTPLGGITNLNTTVQRLDLIAYWRDAQNNLWRATRMDPATGNLVGEIVVTGCTAFTARVTYQDGTTSVVGGPDSTVAGHTFNNINTIVVTTTLASDVVDSRINGGVALRHQYTFVVQPRNLLYERNRGA